MKSIQEASDLIFAAARSFGVEEISIHDAYNRILAEDAFADRDYPPFNRSAMDGYAVVSGDFQNDASPQLKLAERLYAGGIANHKVVSGSCIKIMTGAPVPDGADAVIRVEDSIELDGLVSFTNCRVKPGQHIASQGEDAVAGSLILQKSTRLDASSIPVLAVVGKAKVLVYKLPQVVVASSGNEIVAVGDSIEPHQIRDSNVYTLRNFFKQYAHFTVESLRSSDDKEKMAVALKEAIKADILVLSGGVSKGDADYVPEVLSSLGVKEVFHRVGIKPGSPLWFGILPNGGVAFGLPGNPVAVQVAFKVFIEPYLRACFGMAAVQPLFFPLLSTKVKKTKLDEYFPCKIVNATGVTALKPTRINGSGDIAATLGSDGIAIHPADLDTLNEGASVAFYFWNNSII